MPTITVTIREDSTDDVRGRLINKYEIEHIPARNFESEAGRAKFEEALAALRNLMEI